MALFRKTTPQEPLAVSMAGLKLGNRLLVVGVSDAPLIARLGVKVGLTGRACAVDADEARVAYAARAVEREGVLAEVVRAPWAMLPFDNESFDVAVIRDVLPALAPEERVRCLQEVLRVLRHGGRTLVIETAPRAGLGALISRRTMNEHYVEHGGPKQALEAEGFAAVRVLAERDGLLFAEGGKR